MYEYATINLSTTYKMNRLRRLIGNRIGSIGPNKAQTKTTFKIVEYFQWIKNVGPI